MQRSNKSVIALISCGNILEFYDFMLFAHLGSALTKSFFPGLASEQAHLLGLFLTIIPYFIRPFGGYLFGRLSDLSGRGLALGQTLKYASIASLGIALLPSYEAMGLISTGLLIFFRALQGLSMGGEYTMAGTLMMERFKHYRCTLSAVVGVSGSFGSLLAFGFAWFYLNEHFSEEAWRYAFAVGGAATYLSYYFREKLKKDMQGSSPLPAPPLPVSTFRALFITALTGFYISILYLGPIIYSNYYLTKILLLPASTGLSATMIALCGSITFSLIIGYLVDYFKWNPDKAMSVGAILSIPLFTFGYYLMTQGNLLCQVFMILGSSIFGTIMHPVMNSLFNPKIRSRAVNTSFTFGVSLGAVAHPISGWLASTYSFYHAPLLFGWVVGGLTSYVFISSFMKTSTETCPS